MNEKPPLCVPVKKKEQNKMSVLFFTAGKRGGAPEIHEDGDRIPKKYKGWVPHKIEITTVQPMGLLVVAGRTKDFPESVTGVPALKSWLQS